jgi:hypothetical protein
VLSWRPIPAPDLTNWTRTVRRELEALNTLGLLHEEQEQSIADESKIIWRYSLDEDKLDRETLLAMVHPAPRTSATTRRRNVPRASAGNRTAAPATMRS